MKTKFYLLVAVATFICQQTFSQNKVGTLPGTAGVSPTGAATYTIPIWVSPGTNGMQPDLSIVYSSSGGNGPMGIGWGISGLSAITRTGKDWMHYGNDKSGVDLSTSDRYTLDGNLMMVSNSGAYNAAGTIYHTEAETFSKIEAFGTIYPPAGLNNYASCPEYFKVYAKNGNVLEYGNSTDSRNNLPNTNLPIRWQLYKVTDSYGNYMTYEYENNAEGVIKKISYTGRSGFNPYASVEFEYVNDYACASMFYVGGEAIDQNRKLTDINIKYGNSIIYSYHFSYVSLLTRRLLEIEYSDNNGNHLNATEFDWGVPTSNINGLISNTGTATYKKSEWYRGDYNGDGISDLVAVPHSSNGDYEPGDPFYLHLFDRSGLNTIACSHLTEYDNLELKNVKSGDIDGDGKDELIVYYNCGSATRLVAYSYQSGTFVKIVDDILSTDDMWLQVGDFNGDGKDDAAIINRDYTGSNPNCFIMVPNMVAGTWSQIGDGHVWDVRPEFMFITDFNGNGKADIFITKQSVTEIVELTGNTLDDIYHDGFPDAWHAIYPGDFNGDGKTDLLTWSQASQQMKIRFSTGTGVNGYSAPISLASIMGTFSDNPQTDDEDDNNFFISDYNGDGKDDILLLKIFGGTVQAPIYYSVGNTTVPSFIVELNTPINIDASIWSAATGDFNGDGKADFFKQATIVNIGGFPLFIKLEMLHTFHANEKSHLITGITNGFGKKDIFSYETLIQLAESTNAIGDYYKQTNAVFPVMDYIGALYVVNKSHEEDASGNNKLSEIEYSYQGAKVHRQGRGFMCFTGTTAKAIATNFASRTNYDYHTTYYFPYATQAWTDRVTAPVTLLKASYLVNTTITGSFGGYFNYVNQKTDADAVQGFVHKTYLTYNNDGNLTQQINKGFLNNLAATPEFINTTDYTYISAGNTQNGLPNKVSNIDTEQEIFSPADVYTNQKQYSYYSNNGNVNVITETPNGSGTQKTVTTYDYTGITCGLVNEVSVVGSTFDPSTTGMMPARVTSYKYDVNYRFVTETTNPLGQTDEMEYNYATGNMERYGGIDGLSSSFEYDDFGRLIKSQNPRQLNFTNETAMEYHWASGGSNPAGCVYKIIKTTTGSPASTVYFDAFGRKLRAETQKLEDPLTVRSVLVEKEYETGTGRLWRESLPMYVGATPEWKVYAYSSDDGRLSNINEPVTGKNISFTYKDNEVMTDYQPANMKVKKTLNSLGQVTKITDDDGIMQYDYYAHGNIRKMYTDISQTLMEYDAWAYQTKLIDEDAGETQYEHNAMGEITTEINANNDRFVMEYNVMGMPTRKTCNANDATNSYITDFTYYSAAAAPEINKLEKMETVCNGITQSIEYEYNTPFADLTTFTQTIPGHAPFVTTYTYDDYGRMDEKKYAGDYMLKYEYHGGIGELIKISGKPLGGIYAQLWGDFKENALGQPDFFTSGDPSQFPITVNYKYDNAHALREINLSSSNYSWGQQYNFNIGTGNLKSRNQMFTGTLSESFDYLNNKQLKETDCPLCSTQIVDIKYEPEGNFDEHSAIGIYDYDAVKKHAVKTIVPYSSNPFPLPLASQDILYTAFNKAKRITEDNKELNILYGPDEQRSKSELATTIGGTTNTFTKYFAPDYEFTTDGTNSKEFNYIYSPYGNLLAVVAIDGGSIHTHLIGTDYLGNVSAVFNDQGVLQDEFSYDAWGRRRDPQTWQVYDQNNPAPVPLASYGGRGYTGHEHLEEFGLINMNGRMYDPAIGKMLSADNYNNAPGSSLGMNRYSYAANNPLKYTDPTGNYYKAISWLVFYGGTYITSGGDGGYSKDVANTVVGGMSTMGQATIYKDKNWKVTAGLDVFSVGISANVQYQKGDFAANTSIGYGLLGGEFAVMGASVKSDNVVRSFSSGYAYNGGGENQSWSWGFGSTYTSGDTEISLGFTHYGGEDAQTNWFVGYGNTTSGFHASMTNDAWLPENWGGGDKYRTAAAEIGWDELSIGMNLYTTAPPADEYDSDPQVGRNKDYRSMWGDHEHKTYSSGERVHAGLYFGYNDGASVSRIGIDGPFIQDLFQNFIHRVITRGPYFNTNLGPKTRIFRQSYQYIPFSLY